MIDYTKLWKQKKSKKKCLICGENRVPGHHCKSKQCENCKHTMIAIHFDFHLPFCDEQNASSIESNRMTNENTHDISGLNPPEQNSQNSTESKESTDSKISTFQPDEIPEDLALDDLRSESYLDTLFKTQLKRSKPMRRLLETFDDLGTEQIIEELIKVNIFLLRFKGGPIAGWGWSHLCTDYHLCTISHLCTKLYIDDKLYIDEIFLYIDDKINLYIDEILYID